MCAAVAAGSYRAVVPARLRKKCYHSCYTDLARCSGSEYESIRVWNIATLEQERVMESDGDSVDAILALAVREGEVISGHRSGRIGYGMLRADNGGGSWRATRALL